MNKTVKPTTRAIAALNALLTQVSAITLKDVGAGGELTGGIDLLAHVEIFGRAHTLACQISSGSDPQHARTVLEELRTQIAYLPGKVTPVLILPVLSPEVQGLCDESHAGCLDLRGNGRLAIDEVFVSTRSLPRRVLHQAASVSGVRRSAVEQLAVGSPTDSVLRGFPPSAHAGITHRILHSGGETRGR